MQRVHIEDMQVNTLAHKASMSNLREEHTKSMVVNSERINEQNKTQIGLLQ